MTDPDVPVARDCPKKPMAATGGRCAAGQDVNKREQILSGAHRVFSSMGYDAASMNDITREAQVSKGTIYVYFNSKEDLFEALIERERAVLFAGVEAALQGSGTLEERLQRLAAAVIRILCSDTVIRAHRVVIGVSERMPELGMRFFDRGAARTVRLLASVLQTEIDKGILAIPDVDFAASQFVELATAGLFRRRLFGKVTTLPTEAEITRNATSATAMFLGYYGAREG